MEPDCPPPTLSTMCAAVRPGLDWPALYRFAVAAGCERCLAADEERVAAADELLSHALPELVLLGELAAAARQRQPNPCDRRALRDATASVVRLIDRATAAHARDHGGPLEQWRDDATTTAAAVAAFLDRDPEPERGLLSGTLERGAREIADALLALRRDPRAVPSHLIGAAGEFLVVFAASGP